MKVGSLFSGVGGFDMGLEAAGMEIVWQVEYDEQAQTVLRHHWPNVDLHKDVCDVVGIPLDERSPHGYAEGAGTGSDPEGRDGSGHRVERGGRVATNGGGDNVVGFQPAGSTCLPGGKDDQPAQGEPDRSGRAPTRNGDGSARTNQLIPVDLICGGFPCQDLSVAGNRAGLAGGRSGLFYEFMRLVGEIAPRWVLIENVPGLLSSNGGRDMGAVLGTLGDLGYGYTYRVLDTQYFGPPQRRKRVFIVGCAGGFCPPEVLLEPEGLPWNPPPSREAREGAAGRVAPGLVASGRGVERVGESRGQDPIVVSRALNGPHGDQVSHALCARLTAAECHTLSGDGHPPSVAFAAEVSPTLNASEAGVSRPGGPGLASEEQHHPCQPAPRRLTPLECERLQGWPDDWTRYGRTPDGEIIELADSPRYRMCGNGVSAPVAEWIGRQIMATVENVRRSA